MPRSARRSRPSTGAWNELGTMKAPPSHSLPQSPQRMNARTPIAKLTGMFGLAATVLVLSAASSAAHPVSVTRAYVYVSREQATAKIQVFLEDLFLFHDLKPNERDFLDRDVILQGIELHKQFVAERFVVRTAAGDRLEWQVAGVQKFGLPAEGVPLAELMAHTLTFELEYDFPSPPEFLTFSQRFTDDENVLPSEMKLVAKQENAEDEHELLLRPDDIETIRFSWNLPPLSASASAAEREKWAAQQKKETLGITSYSSVYSFLYINDYEVRHEILVPVLTLEENVLIARDEDDMLDIPEQDAARQQIEAYFCSGNPIEIDGVEVEPVVQRCDFYGLDFRDFAKQAPRKSVPIVSARVGIILAYRSTRPPRTVTLTWNRFNSFVWAINTVVFAYDDMSKTTLSRLGKKNVFAWENPGRAAPAPPKPVKIDVAPSPTLVVPVLSLGFLIAMPIVLLVMAMVGTSWRYRLPALGVLVLLAAVTWPFAQWHTPDPFAPPSKLSDEQAQAVFASLHKNVYSAFEFKEESDIYDALATSTHGDLLQEVYLQIRQGLKMQEQGGAVSRIREISILEAHDDPLPGLDAGEKRPADGFARYCLWTVAGTVEHWGHIHERTNQYEAIFVIEPVGDSWKITDMVLLDEQRVKFETRLRGL